MVARPSVILRIEPMRMEDLPAVHAIEAASFDAPWPPEAYQHDLETNRLAQYLVARVGDEIAAYGGMWLMVDEGHIITFAVHPLWRRQHIGGRLLLAFLDLATDRGAHEATLEVRLSNLPARRLYERFGFRPVGLRPRYYSDNGEDALIMTTDPLADPAMRDADRPAARRDRRRAAPVRPDRVPDDRGRRRVSGRLILAIESSCDETGIALIEDGRRSVANVVASQVALHAPTGGIVPEVAARAHLRWIAPVLDDAWTDAGATWDDVDAVAVTYGPGLAGSLLVGINFAKALAWVHDKPLVGVNHLEGHVYAAWLHDTADDDRPDPVFPLVALVVSGGHTFLAEMRDHLTYRLLGSTLDDAAGEAFDKVGRLLGLGYPGGPAIGRAAEAATRHDRVFPRAWLGDSYDLSFSGLKTAARRIVDEARADAGLADEPDAPLPDDVVAELAWGFQDAVVDVLATKTIRAAEETGARSIVMGGGVAANGALRARLAGEAEARGLPLDRAAAGAVHGQRGDDRGRRRAPVRGRGAGRARSRRAPVAAARRAMTAATGAGRGPPGRPGRPSARRSAPPACAPVTACRRTSSPTRRARRDPRRGRPGAGPADPRDRAGARAC